MPLNLLPRTKLLPLPLPSYPGPFLMTVARLSLLYLAAFIATSVSSKEVNVTIDGWNQDIAATTAENNTDLPTWDRTVITSCKKPQLITKRIGDSAKYIFKGTSLWVYGTIGLQRGIIGFNLDGEQSTFDRSATLVYCDALIYQRSGLSNSEHTLVMTLLEQQPDTNGLPVGVLAIQNIRYTTIKGGKVSIGAIVGGVVGGLVLIGLLVFFLRWRKRPKRPQRTGAFLDSDDVPVNHNLTSGNHIISGAVVTPFDWNPQDATSSQGHPPVQVLIEPQLPSTPSGMQSLLDPRYASPPSSATGSSFDEKKRTHRRAASSITSNPDDNLSVLSGRSSRSQGNLPTPTDGLWMDRIAMRVAEMMEARTNPAPEAPPLYEMGQQGAPSGQNEVRNPPDLP